MAHNCALVHCLLFVDKSMCSLHLVQVAYTISAAQPQPTSAQSPVASPVRQVLERHGGLAFEWCAGGATERYCHRRS